MANSVFNLSNLNGTNGFILNGIAAGDHSGISVSSAGDINGDGIDDLIIGANYADPNGSYSGQSYVVFGKSTGWGATLELSTLNGTNGFILNGIAAYDLSGTSVSSAGDVNGDGIDDLIIGANYADPNSNSNSGQSYVVFGKSTGFSATLDLSTLNGTNGFAINGFVAPGFSGISVSSAGDVNGDGFDDLIIGSSRITSNSNISSGQSYLVFGKSTGFSATLDLSTLNGTNGFILNGIAAYDLSGRSVSSAGDVNGDGIEDLIIGARSADPNGNSSSGQ
ncbi:integrin alpha, partial [Microcoleus sp. C2C6]